jgi:hypothetical protein
MKKLTYLFLTVFIVSCSKTVSIENVSFWESFVYFENKPLSGAVFQNYSDGSIYKSFHTKNGIILDQTHFSKHGDTLATMYYNKDGSFREYIDKTLKNNNISFASCYVRDGDEVGGTCFGSFNIPDANYRLARLYDFWVQSNNLIEDYASPRPPNPKGGARIGGARGESTINITGITIKDYFQLEAGDSYIPQGPFVADAIGVSVKYSTNGYNESYFNEKADLMWYGDKDKKGKAIDLNYLQTSEMNYLIGKEIMAFPLPSEIVISASYLPGDGSSSNAMFTAYLEEGGDYYVMSISGANNNFIYSAKMEFPGDEDLEKAGQIFTGYKIIDPPGYDFNKFELYWNGDVKQGSVLSIRRSETAYTAKQEPAKDDTDTKSDDQMSGIGVDDDKEKERLHESISDFSVTVFSLKTRKFIVRIDELGDGSYRYAAWNANQNLNEKPSLVLYNGERIFEGSGGNNYIQFKRGDFVYLVRENRLETDETPPFVLNVYQNGSLLVDQAGELY